MSEKQELRARLVLEDAHEAARRLKRESREGASGRINWVAAMTLLRTVFDVLLRVDGTKGQPGRDAIRALNERFKAKTGDAEPLWKFIKPERDNIVHVYELGVHAPSYLLLEDGGFLELEDGSGFLLLEEPNEERVDEALAWWEGELAAIEAEMARQPSS